MRSLSLVRRWTSFIVATLAVAASNPSNAAWSVAGSTGGYLGEHAIGLTRISESVRHRMGMLVGWTHDEFAGTIYQGSATYSYSVWNVKPRSSILLQPINPGLFLTYTGHEGHFVKASDDGLGGVDYDQNAIRPGFMLSSRAGWLTGKRLISASAFLSLLDSGVIHAWNNGWTAETNNFVSLGFQLEIEI